MPTEPTKKAPVLNLEIRFKNYCIYTNNLDAAFKLIEILEDPKIIIRIESEK